MDKFIPSIARSISHRDRYVLSYYNSLLNDISAFLKRYGSESPQTEWFEYKYSHFYRKFEPLFRNGFLQGDPRKSFTEDYLEKLHKIIKMDKQINHIAKKYNFEECVFLDKLRKEHTEIVAQNIDQSDLTLLRDWRRMSVARMRENEKDEM